MWRTLTTLCLVLVAGVASAQTLQPHPQYIPSTIVSISPDQSTVVIRAGDFGNLRDYTFEIGKSTKFWGQPPNLNQTGLYVTGRHEGASIFWYQHGVGGAHSTITQLRLAPSSTLDP